MSPTVTFVGPVERVLFLRTVSVYRHLPPEVLAAIARHTAELFVPKGSQLITPEAASDRVLLVVEGGLGIEMSDGRRSTIGPGGTIGLLARLARTPCPITAWTETDTLALEVDWTAHLDVCEEHFAVLLEYMRTIAIELLSHEAKLSLDERERTRLAQLSLPRQAPEDNEMDRIHRALWLGITPSFRKANRDALFELAGHVTESRWADGEVLWNAGHPADHFVLITAGRVAEAGGRSGPPVAAPSLLGLEESLAGQRRLRQIRAVGPVRALRVEVESFLDILEDHFDAALGIASEFAGRLLPLTGGVLPAGPSISSLASKRPAAP